MLDSHRCSTVLTVILFHSSQANECGVPKWQQRQGTRFRCRAIGASGRRQQAKLFFEYADIRTLSSTEGRSNRSNNPRNNIIFQLNDVDNDYVNVLLVTLAS